MKATLTLLVFAIVCSLSNATAQSELSNERKIDLLKKAETEIFKLPYEMDFIKNNYVPEIQASKDSLAPNYPNRENLPRDKSAIDQAYIDWLVQHPSEYDAYYGYLKVFIRTHK